MGCIDETGSLDENEVFVKCDNVVIMRDDEEEDEDEYGQCSAYNNASLTYTTLTCKIAVAKNPCMHPGDIRVLNAVDKPQLRHLVNCIVFPSNGEKKKIYSLALFPSFFWLRFIYFKSLKFVKASDRSFYNGKALLVIINSFDI